MLDVDIPRPNERILGRRIQSEWPPTSKRMHPDLPNVLNHHTAGKSVIQNLHSLVFPASISRKPTKHEYSPVWRVRHPDFEMLSGTVILALGDIESLDRIHTAVREDGILSDNPEIAESNVAMARIQLIPTRWEVDECIVVDHTVEDVIDRLLPSGVCAFVRDIDSVFELVGVFCRIESRRHAVEFVRLVPLDPLSTAPIPLLYTHPDSDARPRLAVVARNARLLCDT
ncbi:hypothetical protein [Haladaptatus halobius]|uniref:hypothetical protein n=1 Tax=Haladaptatus halobius TaxID=2884875 RepID=UPI001D0ACE59|nr:hypothetical protein [Haladaptatus halobius]